MRRALAVLLVLMLVVLVLGYIASRAPKAEANAERQQAATMSAQAAELPTGIRASDTDENDPLGIPSAPGRDVQVLHKPHFTVGYDNGALEPAWVSYALNGPIRFHGKEQRPEHFATDMDVRRPARDSDYVRSGFDRGHMCPAYAMFSRYGEPGLEETFITSNIIPQVHALNAGMWEALETVIAGRDGGDDGWAGSLGQVWVTDGPVLGSAPDHLRAGEAIPRACFMVVTRQLRAGHYDALAFELKNAPQNESIDSYLVSIRQVERDTGLDFDTALANDDQEALEVEPARQLWPMPSSTARQAASQAYPVRGHRPKHR